MADYYPTADDLKSLEFYMEDCCSNVRTSKLLHLVSQLTCCLLSVQGFDQDILTNEIHPIYKLKSDSNRADESDTNMDSNDFLNISFPNIIWNQRPEWEIVVKSVTLTPIVIVAIVANCAVIRIIFKARLTRNPVNLFILNMSIADLFFALIFPWIILVSDLSQNFLMGEYVCRGEGFVLLTLMLVSVLSLTVISYDRLTAVVFPFRKRMSKKMSKIIIWTIWLIALLCSWPLCIWRYYEERNWKDFKERWCREDLKLGVYWLLVQSILVWIPLSILLVSYTAIVYKLDFLEKRQKDSPIQVKFKSKIVRMLFLIVLLFTLCSIPFSAFIIVRNKLDAVDKISASIRNMMFIAHYLLFINSAVNPIIYGLKNDNLSREMRLALPAFFRPKETCNISWVGANQGGRKNDRNGMKERRDNLWNDTSYIDPSPASVVSLKQSNAALQDLGINISSGVTKSTVPD